eukprot:TRINITY_DN13435_c0_g1_i1.p1 TRINITY_DN13435_c0_g1~~TRINITY_DN13435_c0_g1_i1.p1  ORF type:complete len:314 (+),score=54.79 TRINITY_DN13435_c0_g1_i1:615-1556(+)
MPTFAPAFISLGGYFCTMNLGRDENVDFIESEFRNDFIFELCKGMQSVYSDVKCHRFEITETRNSSSLVIVDFTIHDSSQERIASVMLVRKIEEAIEEGKSPFLGEKLNEFEIYSFHYSRITDPSDDVVPTSDKFFDINNETHLVNLIIISTASVSFILLCVILMTWHFRHANRDSENRPAVLPANLPPPSAPSPPSQSAKSPKYMDGSPQTTMPDTNLSPEKKDDLKTYSENERKCDIASVGHLSGKETLNDIIGEIGSIEIVTQVNMNEEERKVEQRKRRGTVELVAKPNHVQISNSYSIVGTESSKSADG